MSTFPSGKIKVLRKVGGGSYKVYKKVKTKASGKFRTRIFQAGKQADLLQGPGPGHRDLQEDHRQSIGCIFSV